MKIFNKIKIEAISKAYTEGIYADTPANRKLGRVGMSYATWWGEKNKKEEEDKKFTLEQIKEKIYSEIKKFKGKNNYITLSGDNDYTFRFSYNTNVDKDSGGINECLIKDKEGKIIKTFKTIHEEDLMSSVCKYIQSLNIDIVSSENKNDKEINVEENTSIIDKKMKEAKDSQTGTILIKGSGDKLIYLNRDRNGRWLKDFNTYTIRDSKRNILAQGKANSEKELKEKLNEYLSKNKIKLEI